jgi:hypothetical protein
MFASLFMLAMSLTHGHAYERAVGAATTVCNVVATEDASWAFPALAAEDPWAARAKLGRLLITWSYYESSYMPGAIGDSGRSCGIMQTAPSHTGQTCRDLLTAHASYRAALTILRGLVRDCGSLPRALGAYAGGHCGDAMDLVERRCAAVGGC